MQRNARQNHVAARRSPRSTQRRSKPGVRDQLEELGFERTDMLAGARRQQEIDELRGMVSELAKKGRTGRGSRSSRAEGSAAWNLEARSESIVDGLSGTPLNRAAWLQVLSRTNAGTTRKAWKGLLVSPLLVCMHPILNIVYI